MLNDTSQIVEVPLQIKEKKENLNNSDNKLYYDSKTVNNYLMTIQEINNIRYEEFKLEAKRNGIDVIPYQINLSLNNINETFLFVNNKIKCNENQFTKKIEEINNELNAENISSIERRLSLIKIKSLSIKSNFINEAIIIENRIKTTQSNWINYKTYLLNLLKVETINSLSINPKPESKNTNYYEFTELKNIIKESYNIAQKLKESKIYESYEKRKQANIRIDKMDDLLIEGIEVGKNDDSLIFNNSLINESKTKDIKDEVVLIQTNQEIFTIGKNKKYSTQSLSIDFDIDSIEEDHLLPHFDGIRQFTIKK